MPMTDLLQELHLTEPELELFRGESGRVASPPLRMFLLNLLRNRTRAMQMGVG